ncbi:MAG: radical SAM protein [Candidatus Thorarchaeota archaeon]|nr:radical SAM protein [Candidatus Thorarchaeota archaeon]
MGIVLSDNIKAKSSTTCLIHLVEYVRVSAGTAIVLGIEKGPKQNHFTTAFLMTYSEEGCSANCAFCPQAVSSDSDHRFLSRIGWPLVSFEDVESKISGIDSLKRICIQTLNYPNVVIDTIEIVQRIRRVSSIPISTCIHPIDIDQMKQLKNAGINNIGIAIDACNAELFDSIKGVSRNGPYTWSGHMKAIEEAQGVFGKSQVTTHLIVGLGENESQVSEFLFIMNEMGVRVGLFAFTSIKGTALEKRKQPHLAKYRRIQILRELIARKLITRSQMSINEQGEIEFNIGSDFLRETLSSGTAFRVTGCAGCNRPYYNERPRGPMYNYPRPLEKDEVERAFKEAGLVI